MSAPSPSLRRRDGRADGLGLHRPEGVERAPAASASTPCRRARRPQTSVSRQLALNGCALTTLARGQGNHRNTMESRKMLSR